MSNRIINHETIFEMEARLKVEAKKLAKEHIDTKPIKYLLK
ncbi:hypothetical protein [Flavobacterium sp.]